MQIESHLSGELAGYKNIAFSQRFKKLLERKSGKYILHCASLSELSRYSQAARSRLGGLAPDEVLFALREKNKNIFQVITSAGDPSEEIGFNAALPLAAEGIAALLDGSFDPSQPSCQHIVGENERAAAIYGWVIYSPRSIVAVMTALANFVERYAPGGCSLFCRAANQEAFAAFKGMGFEQARLTYPTAPDDLLVVHAEYAKPSFPKLVPQVDVRVARTLSDLMMVTAIRAATYMSEQECPFDEEFDGNDFCAAHLIGHVAGEPAGCIRVRFFKDFVKFERLAVRREYRNSKLSFQLVRAAMRYVAEKGFTKVYGHARHDLVRFWQSFGFRVIQNRPVFTFSDVNYVEMEGKISERPDPLRIGDNPLKLIRPEGAWDTPGPLERPADPLRSERISPAFRYGAYLKV